MAAFIEYPRCPMITHTSDSYQIPLIPWWRHQMEKFSVLLAICAGNSPATG